MLISCVCVILCHLLISIFGCYDNTKLLWQQWVAMATLGCYYVCLSVHFSVPPFVSLHLFVCLSFSTYVLPTNSHFIKLNVQVGDIYGGHYEMLGLPSDIIASSFGKASRSSKEDTETRNATCQRDLLRCC